MRREHSRVQAEADRSNIRELQQLRKELAQLVAACDANADEAHCPVIERLTH